MTLMWDKLKANIAAAPPDHKLIVLISTGSFNPVHLQHVRMFEIAKSELEKRQQEQLSVVGGFLSPSHDCLFFPVLNKNSTVINNDYVRGKLGDNALPATLRTDLLYRAVGESRWLDVETWECKQRRFIAFPSVAARLQSVLTNELAMGNIPRDVQVMFLCGADLVHRCRLHDGLGYGLPVVAMARAGCLEVKETWKSPNSVRGGLLALEVDPALISDMSSTEVRQRLKEKKSIEDLVHPAVEEALIARASPKEYKIIEYARNAAAKIW
eukprot:GEMP01073883.1.p1 GENE.GEMP01073883.1~~GEMP01073883.1.p1  ORF type:complete len:269 (-),score=69.71 GEMP01073883.1:270-1076(-)